MLFSIVRTVQPGAVCSYPAGRCEVYHLADYNVCAHSVDTGKTIGITHRGRSVEEARQQAQELAQTFQNCCYVDGIRYTVEEFDQDDHPGRAPMK